MSGEANLVKDIEYKNLFFHAYTNIVHALSSNEVNIFNVTDHAHESQSLPEYPNEIRKHDLLGFVPDADDPRDLKSFLYLLIHNSCELGRGVTGVYSGAGEEIFTVQTYLVLVTADMKGQEKLMAVKGN